MCTGRQGVTSVLLFVLAVTFVSTGWAQNWVEKKRDRQEIATGQEIVAQSQSNLVRLRELIAEARASEVVSASVVGEMDAIMAAQVGMSGRSATQADQEVRQSSRELRGDWREFRRNKDNDVSKYETFRDRRNRRNDWRDRQNDRKDAQEVDALAAQQSSLLSAFHNATSSSAKINHAIDFAASIERQVSLASAEIQEDKVELREDRRETRDDRRERFFRD